MSSTLKHKFVSTKADSTDTTLIRASSWNDEHAFAGGANGQALTRDSTQTDGAKWVDAGALLSGAYPIGSIYISVISTNPATSLGFGTWVAFATGLTLVGIDAGQTEFDVAEETGGAKTHALVTAEMPAHTHTYSNSLGGGAAVLSGGFDPTSTVSNTGSTGGNAAHNNLQPYIVVFMWKRTA